MRNSHMGAMKAKGIVALALLLLVWIPTAAIAYPLYESDAGTERSEGRACLVDPRILKLEPELCGPSDVGSDPALAAGEAPEPSSRTDDVEIAWWAIGLAVGIGAVGAIAIGVRGRPQALS
jgi:hypothetical protein